MDWKKIIDEADFNFADFYEKSMQLRERLYEVPQDLREEASRKRKFGIEKYGDRAFQTSFDKSVVSPFLDHFMEELVDLLNYTLHTNFILAAMGICVDDRSQEIVTHLKAIKEIHEGIREEVTNTWVKGNDDGDKQGRLDLLELDAEGDMGNSGREGNSRET